MKHTTCEDNEATDNKHRLERKTASMRHISRTNRVNLPWLYDVVQNDENTSDKCANTKQQRADIFEKGFTNEEMWKVFMSIIGLVDMDSEDVEDCERMRKRHV